jgi:putative redox protein
MTTKTAFLRQLQGATFAAKSDSGHWVMMDAPEQFDGMNGAPRPKELILYALAGCTASDVVGILKKKRVPFTDFEMKLAGQEREEHPKIFTDIHIEYIVHGNDINPADVERAIELSTTKYCSVSAMLQPTVKLTHSYRIIPSGVTEPAGNTVSFN